MLHLPPWVADACHSCIMCHVHTYLISHPLCSIWSMCKGCCVDGHAVTCLQHSRPVSGVHLMFRVREVSGGPKGIDSSVWDQPGSTFHGSELGPCCGEGF